MSSNLWAMCNLRYKISIVTYELYGLKAEVEKSIQIY
jgi:hypothetical protein